jgi:AcrR family transcriptional regulator
MAAAVEHDARKRKILDKALDVFMDVGYEDTTYQKIADRCGITRTTLYIYFRNKKEIFLAAIKQLLAQVEHDIVTVSQNKTLSVSDRLTAILCGLLGIFEENRKLLRVILDYLLYISRSEGDPDVRVSRRTVKMRHYVNVLVIEGIKKNQIKNLDVASADEIIYGIIEGALYRLAVLKRDSVADLKKAVPNIVKKLCS